MHEPKPQYSPIETALEANVFSDALTHYEMFYHWNQPDLQLNWQSKDAGTTKATGSVSTEHIDYS